MSIGYFEEDVVLPLMDCDALNKVLKSQLRIHKLILGELNFIFCSDDFLLGMNKQFLNHDYFTDVITFDYCEGRKVSGDVFISTERVLVNSINFGKSFDDELSRVIFHGFLHLLKYADKEPVDIEEMRRMESVLLERYSNV
jgi:probable rRNA maturation factor